MIECQSRSAKKASKVQKNAVVLLNDRIKNLKYEVQKLHEGFLVWTTVEGTIYEGRGNSKKQAKQEAARNALSGLESASPGEHATHPGNKKSKKKKT